MYAVYPIHEPHTTRYRIAPIPRMVHVTLEFLSKSTAKIRFAIPANRTCHAIALNGSAAAVCHFFESTEPNAQLKDPSCSASAHHSWRCPRALGCANPDERSGQMSTTTPAMPSASPILPRREM